MPRGQTSDVVTVLKHYFARQAAAALLKMAKTTSDYQMAAGLVARAADIKNLLQEMPPPMDAVAAEEPSDEGQEIERHPLPIQTVKQPLAFPRREMRPSWLQEPPSRNKRAQGMPGAWLHPQPCVQW
jgi:hypothetical protein